MFQSVTPYLLLLSLGSSAWAAVPVCTNYSNSNAGVLLTVGATTLSAAANDTSTQVCATVNGDTGTVLVNAGSMTLPCSAAIEFCKTGQSNVTVLTGESAQFTAGGKLSRIEINSATNATFMRLNGKNWKDVVVDALQAENSSLGAITERNVSDSGIFKLTFASGKLSLAAQLPLQTNPALPNSVRQLSNGTLQVVAQGVVITLMPTLLDTVGFMTQLNAANPPEEMRTNSDGSIVMSYKRGIFSVRPSRLTTSADTSGFTVGSDGNLRFGNQTILPAPYSFDQLSEMVARLGSTASLSQQNDGKLALALQGVTYILTPDYQVMIPTERYIKPDFEIKNGKLIANYLFGISQSFSIGQ